MMLYNTDHFQLKRTFVGHLGSDVEPFPEHVQPCDNTFPDQVQMLQISQYTLAM